MNEIYQKFLQSLLKLLVLLTFSQKKNFIEVIIQATGNFESFLIRKILPDMFVFKMIGFKINSVQIYKF